MAVVGQNWEENNYLRHTNISAPLDGIYGSKAVNKKLLGVSSKTLQELRKAALRVVGCQGVKVFLLKDVIITTSVTTVIFITITI